MNLYNDFVNKYKSLNILNGLQSCINNKLYNTTNESLEYNKKIDKDI